MLIHDNYQVVDINLIREDPENPKTHPEENIDQICASLEAHGFTKPLVVHKDTKIIVAGNGTYRAAKIKGYKKVPIILMDCDFQTARSYGIADNRLSESSKWDLDIFNKHIKELNEWNPEMDWQAIGFKNSDIETLLSAFDAEVNTDNNEFDKDKAATEGFKDSDKPEMAKPIKLTTEQRSMFDLAAQKMRDLEQDPKISDGRVLELLSAEYLS